MKTLIDIPDPQLADLAAISTDKKISRDEVIREAITHYLASNQSHKDKAFGIWKNKIDGLVYQEQARAEW